MDSLTDFRIFRSQTLPFSCRQMRRTLCFAVLLSTIASSAIAQLQDCVEVLIEHGAETQEPDPIDWIGLSREQREITGQELLPEHDAPPPPKSTLSKGCAIFGASSVEGSIPEDFDLNQQITGGAFGQIHEETAESDKASEEANLTNVQPSTKKALEEPWPLLSLWRQIDGMLKWFGVILLAGFSCAFLFAGNEIYKITRGIILSRHKCQLDAQLITHGHEIQGEVRILGLLGCRFFAKNATELARLRALQDEPEKYDFEMRLSEFLCPVVVDPISTGGAPAFFVFPFTRFEQAGILAESEIKPKLVKWQPNQVGSRRRRQLLEERRQRFERAQKMASLA